MSSSKEERLPLKEMARRAETKTIIINEDPNPRALPDETESAGALYVLQPDDVTFSMPVTVTVAIDASQNVANGGAEVGECTCKVDGVAKKTVTSLCNEAAFGCGFPKQQGDSPSSTKQ